MSEEGNLALVDLVEEEVVAEVDDELALPAEGEEIEVERVKVVLDEASGDLTTSLAQKSHPRSQIAIHFAIKTRPLPMIQKAILFEVVIPVSAVLFLLLGGLASSAFASGLFLQLFDGLCFVLGQLPLQRVQFLEVGAVAAAIFKLLHGGALPEPSQLEIFAQVTIVFL